jgi:hypothetical protein
VDGDDLDLVEDFLRNHGEEVLEGTERDIEEVVGEGEGADFAADLAARVLERKEGGEVLWHGAPVGAVARLEGHGVVVVVWSVRVVDLGGAGGWALDGLDVVDLRGELPDHVANLGGEGE